MRLLPPGSLLLTLALASAVLLGCPDRNDEPAEPAAATAPAPAPSMRSAAIAPESELISGPEPSPSAQDDGPAAVSSGKRRATHKQPPRPLREDVAPPRDVIRGQEAVGVSLQALWHWPETPAPHDAPEVAKDALAAARERVALATAIDVSPLGRMRWVLQGRALPLPQATELRARDDRYGHVLLWPDGRRYRLLPAGMLRAVLAELRPDQTPLVPGTVQEKPPGSVLGFDTSRTEVSSQLGTLTLDQAVVAGAGAGAPLLCRALVELAGVEPSCPACADGRLPLRAEYEWPRGGRLEFVVTALLRGQQLQVDDLLAPPPQAAFRPDGLPRQPHAALLSPSQLAQLRTRDTASSTEQDAHGIERGLLAVNRTHMLQYLLLDGVPIDRLRPGAQHHILGPRPGRYVVSWRDFLGLQVEPRLVVDVPGRVAVGDEPDAGAEKP